MRKPTKTTEEYCAGFNDGVSALREQLAVKPLPIIRGCPVTRDEVVEALQEAYDVSVKYEQRYHPGTTGFPDLKLVIDHICEHGLTPKTYPPPAAKSKTYETPYIPPIV